MKSYLRKTFKDASCRMIEAFSKNNLNKNGFFYLLVLVSFLFILLSSPFLKIPYDMWDHLSQIVNLYNDGQMYNFWEGNAHAGRGICWYYPWALFFKIFHINSFNWWPKIIHVIQFSFAAVCNFFFCYTVFRLLLKNSSVSVGVSSGLSGDSLKSEGNNVETNPNIPKIVDISSIGDQIACSSFTRYMAFFSTLLWLIGNGIDSGAYHNSWIMWYSTNPQCLSMSLFWLGTSLVLIIAFDYSNNFSKKVILSIFCALILALIIIIHPLEGSYFLIHITFITVIMIRRVWELALQRWKQLIPLFSLGAIAVFLTVFFAVSRKLVKFPASLRNLWRQEDPFTYFFEQIRSNGEIIVTNLNKFPDAYSEIVLFSLVLGLALLLYMILNKNIIVNKRLYAYISVSSIIFILIPIIKPLAGFFGFLTVSEQVYRFILGSPWFIIIPLTIYFIIQKLGKQSALLTNFIFLNIFSIALFIVISKFTFHHALYKNCISIVSSMNEKKVGVSFRQDDIRRFQTIIEQKLASYNGKKKPLLHIRNDWAIIAKCYFGTQVLSKGKAGSLRNWLFYCSGLKYRLYLKYPKKFAKYKNSKEYYEKYKNYKIIEVDLPVDFPRDESIFKDFYLEKPSDRLVRVENLGGVVNEITANNKVVQSFSRIKKIARIQMVLANYCDRNNTKDVFLKIKEQPDSEKSLAEVKVNASKIKDNSWHTFKFPDYVHLDPKKTYYICLESPESYPGNAITVYKSDKNRYNRGELYVNGQKTGVDLCMKIWKGY